jgi:pimeloyl-ACP methyl ester carboxylesterase
MLRLIRSRVRAERVIALIAASLFLATTIGAVNAQSAPPLAIAREGYFFVGGHLTDAKQPMADQMYVEYQIPAKKTHRYPIVMIEGGGQTGVNFTGTPDGREGWAQYFLRHGYAVYVCDQVGRGRSGYNADSYGPAVAQDMTFMLNRFAAPEVAKLWPQARLHTQFPGVATPSNPVFQQFVSQETPSIADFTEQQKLNVAALVALFDKIGPGVLLTHSQSGAFSWPTADARPNLVKALLDVEPSGPPVHDIINNGPPNWFSDAKETKLYGLEMVPLTYSPPITDPSELAFEQAPAPSNPDLVTCWRQKAPARTLPQLAKVKILIIQSEASYHAPYDYCTAAYLTQAGVKNTYIHLADLGIHGNGHMMMLEKNNMAIAAVMEKWLNTTLH